jgi:hypothetical protein
MDVWSVCGRGVQKRHGRDGSFREIVEVLLARCTREELTLAVLVAKKNLKKDWGLLLNSNGLMSYPSAIVYSRVKCSACLDPVGSGFLLHE